MNTFRRPLALIVLVFLVSTARAQTGPALLQKTWDPDQWFDSSTDALFEAGAHTDSGPNADPDIRISEYESQGGVQVIPNNVASTRIGYSVLDYDVVSHNPILPRNLLDARVGFVQPILKVNEWFVAIDGAVGSAGNKPFSDSEAIYGTGDIIVGRQFHKTGYLFVGIDYNGNRTFLPDTPIPGFAYADTYNDYCTYVIGLPYTSITFNPLKGLQVEGGFTLVDTLEANIGYQFTKSWAVFGQYSDLLSPFHIDDTSPDRRMFFQTRQVEVGMRWNQSKRIRFSVSGGWAFDQEFSTGWDSRNLTPVQHVSDGPFARFRLEMGF